MSRRRKKFQLENIEIEKYAAEGKSIAYWEDKVLFVQGAIPGDVVNCYVFKNKKDWAEAKINEVVIPSELRQEAFCEHFELCGGCKWQMLPYEQQVLYKDQQVRDQLERLGNIEIKKYLPIIPCKEDRLYRNKMEFTFSNKRYLGKEDMEAKLPFEKDVLGFHAPKVFDKIIDIETCFLQAEPTNAIKNFVRNYAKENNISFQDIRNHEGLLRNLIIRMNTKGDVLLNLVVRENETETINGLCHALQNEFPAITSLHYTINGKMNDSIYDLEVTHFSGEKFITETLGQTTFKISPKSFFQTNSKQATVLYDVVKNFVGQNEILYDLYCGTGSIGLYLADTCKKLIGVETVEDAIVDARENATNNNIHHADFFAGDVIKICTSDFFAKHGKADCVVVDPPRAGMHAKLVEKLLEIESPKIVYVSCNPATQARDLSLLAQKYSIIKSQAVDMFPQTHHIENVVLLEIK
jgi:23S rRNA (uracil1939-C5)-methyltransferase